MKKLSILLSIAALFCISFNSSAQDDFSTEESVERTLSFYLENLDLDGEQKNQFVEIYRENAYRKLEMQQKRRSGGMTDQEDFMIKKLESLSEEEAQKIVMKKLEDKEKKFQSKKEYQLKIMKVIGAKNLLKLQALEQTLKEKSVEEHFERTEDTGGTNSSDR